jgi:hypothetical protein
MVAMRNTARAEKLLEDLERCQEEEAGMPWHTSFSVTVTL